MSAIIASERFGRSTGAGRSSFLTTAAITCVVALAVFGGNAAGAGELCVTVRHVEVRQGTVMIGLYDGARQFKDDHRRDVRNVEPSAGEVSVCFEGLPANDYAVGVFQDTNGTGLLERNFFGEPTKPYGFSRDGKAMFGPPDFEDIAVRVGDGRQDTVATLRR
jgi:uncharacterized protein (DUF2141 family)